MYFFASGLVKRNVSRQSAVADIQVIAKQLITGHARDYPEHFQMTARPMNEVIVDDFKQTLFLLIAAVILLLLISSSNVASLLLTHYSARSREIALRSALGASCGRLIRQLFVESLLLGLAGGDVGNILLQPVPASHRVSPLVCAASSMPSYPQAARTIRKTSIARQFPWAKQPRERSGR